MSIHEARCVYQGNTFVGVYDVAGSGTNETISVRYSGDEIEAQTGGLPHDAVAGTLLSELVVRKAIAAKVKAAVKQPQLVAGPLSG